ncbi:MAG: BamA/TamA family outer membrane protein, partial [Bacteroidaceae bacterium]|nr:BamA/TamA family outer membrane protein [Bacteroidaceae bacterium]
MRIPPKSLYQYQKHNDALTNLNNLALFRSIDLQYKPRKTPSSSLLSPSPLLTDTLDLHLTAVLDKPYSFYLETQVKHKLSGRTGPLLRIGITKKNAFRGAESFDINLHASYEYQFNNTVKAADRNSFEVGADASVKWPRLLVPFLKYKTYQTPPSTDLTLSFNLAHRPTYYRLLTLTAAFQYQWTPAKKTTLQGTQQHTYTFERPNNITHTFSPFTLTYQKQSSTTPLFDSILNNNPYLKVAMQDMFIPKMQYNLTYKSPDNYKNPIHLSLTITEAGNLVSLINKLFFKQDWTRPNKTMFNNIYAQFLKFQADISKTWQISSQDKLVAHANLGIIYTYGNIKQAPYVEQFYIGGANTVRAFTARGVGPGAYRPTNQNTSYIDQTGDLLLVLNLEYRRKLINNLYAALFIDAGNIWTLKPDTNRPGANITLSRLLNNIALGTGIGLRYDLDFIVLRLDWGIGLHA